MLGFLKCLYSVRFLCLKWKVVKIPALKKTYIRESPFPFLFSLTSEMHFMAIFLCALFHLPPQSTDQIDLLIFSNTNELNILIQISSFCWSYSLMSSFLTLEFEIFHYQLMFYKYFNRYSLCISPLWMISMLDELLLILLIIFLVALC